MTVAGTNYGGCLRPSRCLPWHLDMLLSLAVALVWPCQASFSGLVSLGIPTAVERESSLRLLLRRCCLGPLYLGLFLLFLPLALLAAPLRCLLSLFRKPYQYSVDKRIHTHSEEIVMLDELAGQGTDSRKFGIASANLCLLPEFIARINMVSHAGERARTIGERIVVDQFFYGDVHKSILCPPEGPEGARVLKHQREQVDGFVGGLETHFPQLDFFCMQEVFDWNYNRALRNQLHKVFPYILHDIGVTSLSSNFFMFNSGLMFASKHPVLDVEFKCYTHCVYPCVFASKGLLMVKVQIGRETDSTRHVGYIFSTHLQSYQGTEQIIVKQLDEILEWTSDFQKQTADSRDVVLFDILCGDLNFDNMSPGDKINRNHNIFDVYSDPCMMEVGKDKPWAVGTEFKQIYIHESTVSTPEALKASLSDPCLRHRHLTDADVQEHTMESLVHVSLRRDALGNVTAFPQGGMRRIDLILHRKNTPLALSKFNFVTRLATLSDHIPVAMVFKAKA